MDEEDEGAIGNHTTTAGAEDFEQFYGNAMAPQTEPQQSETQQLMKTINALLTQNAVLIGQIAQQNRGESKYHILPDLTKGFYTFNGEWKPDKPNEAKDWLDSLKSMALLHKWPEAYSLETARTHLSGAARHWFETRKTDIVGWEDFQYHFKKTFVRQESITHLWKQMTARIQTANENISLYFHEKVNLCKRLDLFFLEIKEQIIIGLISRELASMLMARHHTDIDHLFEDMISCHD